MTGVQTCALPICQGIGAVKHVPTAGELVARLAAEYEAAKAELAGKTAFTAGAPLAIAAE